ncbi:hypothetical protein ACG7TL_006658 [Trametes sanguinea]
MDRTSSSESSSDSPPHVMSFEDESFARMPSQDPYVPAMANLKRPFPSRVFPSGPSDGAREQKTRKRDPRTGSSNAGPPSMFEHGAIPVASGGRGQRDERDLVDHALVDQLRDQFGDPFDDSPLKKAAGSLN